MNKQLTLSRPGARRLKELCHPPHLWHQQSPNPSALCLRHHGVPLLLRSSSIRAKWSLARCSSTDSHRCQQPNPCFHQLCPPLLPLLRLLCNACFRATGVRRGWATIRWGFGSTEAKSSHYYHGCHLQRWQPPLSPLQRLEVELSRQYRAVRLKWEWEQWNERGSHQWICKVGGRPSRPSRPSRTSGTQRTQRCGPSETK